MTMGNPVTRFQIVSKAPNETASFYAKLFDWKIDADNALGYREIDTGSKEGIQGGIWPAPPQAPDFVQLFVSVPDVKAKVAEAQKLGAKLLIPPTVLPDGDEMAVLHDPNGMPFAVWKDRRASG
jgi:predicted enzyme related to lactoylglutathione lyase